MRYVIISKQDYSNRFAGSWGSIILDHPDEVDAVFLRNSDRKVVVESDDGTPLTEEMNLEQWRAWKELNRTP